MLSLHMPVAAKEIKREKIMHFGSPIEFKRCGCNKWVSLTPWDKNCIDPKVCNLQHEYYFVAEANDVSEAVKTLADACMKLSTAAAATAIASTPGELTVKIGAGYAAGKGAFLACIQSKSAIASAAGLALLLDHKTSWK